LIHRGNQYRARHAAQQDAYYRIIARMTSVYWASSASVKNLSCLRVHSPRTLTRICSCLRSLVRQLVRMEEAYCTRQLAFYLAELDDDTY
jgi:hypothetical protein